MSGMEGYKAIMPQGQSSRVTEVYHEGFTACNAMLYAFRRLPIPLSGS
jgi:regulator of replication initiation timing